MSCSNAAHCRAISFLCTGRFFVERIFSCAFVFCFNLCSLTYIIISVSAVPVGALDRVAGLLNRKWCQYHACGKYADLEKKFFGENEEIMREIFFDTNNPFGVDSDEDMASADVPVNYYDFVPEMFSEEGQLRRLHAADSAWSYPVSDFP